MLGCGFPLICNADCRVGGRSAQRESFGALQQRASGLHKVDNVGIRGYDMDLYWFSQISPQLRVI